MDFAQVLSTEFNMKLDHSSNIIKFLDEGCTVPFIARYRKEWTGSCDDQVLREFADRLQYLRNLEKRKEEVINSITEQGKMTDELMKAIEQAYTQTEVEDIYRPYKQKRKTRASEAIRKGLQPLADIILEQKNADIKERAKEFINEEVLTVEDAINGAKDIIAEMISDDANLRKALREFYEKRAKITCELIENENSKTYETYAAFSQEVGKIPSHRILAINRGEKEDCLKVKIEINEEQVIQIISKAYLKVKGGISEDKSNYNESNIYVEEAIVDG
ncbi:MAG: Tex-like N-terminal domain-containing protein, partial [Christensenellales bacterium]